MVFCMQRKEGCLMMNQTSLILKKQDGASAMIIFGYHRFCLAPCTQFYQ